MMFFPAEVICAFVCDRFRRKLSDVIIVNTIHIVASSEKIDGAFCFRGVIEKNIRMRFQYYTVCLPSVYQCMVLGMSKQASTYRYVFSAEC
jgi:hypothetical protein